MLFIALTSLMLLAFFAMALAHVQSAIMTIAASAALLEALKKTWVRAERFSAKPRVRMPEGRDARTESTESCGDCYAVILAAIAGATGMVEAWPWRERRRHRLCLAAGPARPRAWPQSEAADASAGESVTVGRPGRYPLSNPLHKDPRFYWLLKRCADQEKGTAHE